MPKLRRPLYGPKHPDGPTRGRDVRDFVKRTLHRLPKHVAVGGDFFPKPKAGFDPVYNAKTENAIETLRRLEERKPFKGPFRQDDLDALWPYADEFARWVYSTWRAPVPKPILVEPDQGWNSLHHSLWEPYSMCRLAGKQFTDLGTYNSASKLPSGRPSDHAVSPAMAFDIGIEPDTGWNNLTARALAVRLVKRPEVEYVILGNRIWSDWRKFWGAYYGGGHLNHIHVSGHR